MLGSIFKGKETNTGPVDGSDAPEAGLPIEGEAATQEDGAQPEPSDIAFVDEKRAVLDFFNADRMEIDEAETSDMTDMDCAIKLFDDADNEIAIAAITLGGAYDLVVKGLEDVVTSKAETPTPPSETLDVSVDTIISSSSEFQDVEVKKAVAEDPVNG